MAKPSLALEISQDAEQRLRIDELTRENAELRAKLATQLAATTAANVGIWEWDLEADSLVWDERMYRLYGLSPARFSGVSDAWRSAIHPDDAAAAFAAVEHTLAGRAEFDVKFRIVTPSGLVRHLHAVASVHRDACGKPLRMSGVNWDISAEVVA